MKAGPDMAMIASLVGDPARSNMLTALMSGTCNTVNDAPDVAEVPPTETLIGPDAAPVGTRATTFVDVAEGVPWATPLRAVQLRRTTGRK